MPFSLINQCCCKSTTKAVLLLTIILATIVSNVPTVQCRELPRVNKDSLFDCKARAEAGECLPDGPDPKLMRISCGTTCVRWREDLGHQKQFLLDDHESFYEMSAKTAFQKKVVEFDRFDGYVTVIVPVAKTCSNNSVAAKAIFDSIASLKNTFKYNLELVIFPYLHPTVDYDADGVDCSEFEEMMAVDQKKTKYFVMEESNMDSASGDLHPVFQLFFDAMEKDLKEEQGNTNEYDEVTGADYWDKANRRGEDVGDEFVIPPLYDYFWDNQKVEEFIFSTQTYFVVEPDGNTVYFHYDKSLVDIRDALKDLTKLLVDEGEL